MLAVIFGVAGVIFVYLGAFTPDAINFDSSWEHIPIAVDYARAGRLIPFPPTTRATSRTSPASSTPGPSWFQA